MNPHKDKDLRKEHGDAHSFDEICYWLGLELRPNSIEKRWEGLILRGDEVNHLWSLGRRPDVWVNFIKLSAGAHKYFHKHLPEGRVTCLLAKFRKSERLGDPRDSDIAALDAAAGKHVIGVVEAYGFTDSMMQALQSELLERMRKAVKEAA